MPRPKIDRRRFPRTREVLMRVAPLALIVIAVALIGYKLGWYEYRHAIEHIQRLRRTHSVVGFTVLFVIAFGVGTSLGVPGMPLIVTAGVLFGTLLGSILSWIGAMLGATIGYWIARTIGHDVITRWLKRFKRVDSAVGQARNFSGMIRLRLIPVLPLATVNFAGGLARANFLAYLAATAIGVVPVILIYTYFADRLIESVGSGRTDALKALIIASLLLMALSLAPRFFAREKSDQSTAA
jgi:uncharacterized membrane protein YdjX (TVP38/TMEM64 family)